VRDLRRSLSRRRRAHRRAHRPELRLHPQGRRARLWNAVEATEKREDAQLAKDFILALPHELTHEQRVALTREFVREQFTDKGYVADIAWHAPSRDDSLNFHAHVMVTMRKVEGEGFTRLKERPAGADHPSKQWRHELVGLREAWADTTNKHLEAAGLDVRVDARSLAAQGIDREPEPKLGPVADQIERAGRESHAGNDRRAVQARNAERAQLSNDLARATAEQAKIITLMTSERSATARTPDHSRDEDDKKKRRPRAGSDLEWTDRGGLVEHQRSAMDWVREAHEHKLAKTEQSDRKRETRTADEMKKQHLQNLMRKYGGDFSSEIGHERGLGDGGRERAR
jgi:ATP-dependent exoDNAse (exonuclease V) alpha subunit